VVRSSTFIASGADRSEVPLSAIKGKAINANMARDAAAFYDRWGTVSDPHRFIAAASVPARWELMNWW
jgi:hypothetical protein